MTPTISAIVATYGDAGKWDRIAQRAIASLEVQSARPHEIIRHHGLSLAEARNSAAQVATGDWLMFLDADDVLDQHYVRAMTAEIKWLESKKLTSDDLPDAILQPATSALYEDGTTDNCPNVIPRRRQSAPSLLKSLRRGNHLVVASVMRRSSFLTAGGYWEEPSMEDWSLFLRMAALGAFDVQVPDAIYYVFQTTGGRNATSTFDVFRSILDRFDKWCANLGVPNGRD